MFNEDFNEVLTKTLVDSLVRSSEPFLQQQLKDIEDHLRAGLKEQAIEFIQNSFQVNRTGDHLNIKIYLPENNDGDTAQDDNDSSTV